VVGIRLDPARAICEGSSDIPITIMTAALGANTIACKDFVPDGLLQAGTLAGRAEIHALVSATGVQPGWILKVLLQGYDKVTAKTNGLVDDTLAGL
jgi:hypothetical protein